MLIFIIYISKINIIVNKKQAYEPMTILCTVRILYRLNRLFILFNKWLGLLAVSFINVSAPSGRIHWEAQYRSPICLFVSLMQIVNSLRLNYHQFLIPFGQRNWVNHNCCERPTSHLSEKTP